MSGWRPRGLLALALLAACATPQPAVPSREARAALARVAVVAALEPPQVAFEGFARNKLEGAGLGAVTTFGVCVQALGGGGSCEGAICGAALILWLGVCTASSAVGGVVGAVVAPSASTVRAAEAELREALAGNPLQEALRTELLAAARAEGTELGAPPTPVDALLEVALTRVGTEGSGIDPPLLLYMDARASLLRAADRAALFEADYRYEGGRRTLAEWSADHGAPLLGALEVGYRTLGAEIFERIFRLHPFPDRGSHVSGLFANAFGLAPLAPTTRGQLSGDPLIGSWFEWPEVESRRPRLHWQSFPRASDVAAQPGEMARVSRVRYDLRIAREANSAPAELVYRRDGLASSVHRLEQPLLPGTRYFWTVRARFELDGRTQVTEWSGVRADGAASLAAPSRSSFRFRTP